MLGLGSTAQLGLGISIRLQDQFSNDAKKLSATLRQLKQDTDSSLVSAARDYRDRAAAIGFGAMMVTKGMISMAREGAQLDHRLNQIAIISGEAKNRLRELGQGLSGEFAQTLDESYAAIFENTKAGVNKGLDLITRYQVAVSKATDETLGGQGGVAKGLLSIMNAMQLPLDQFPRIANAVTAAANASQSSVASLNESMKYSAHTFHQFNVPLEDALALLARLSQAGIEGSSAGTAMQNMFTHLSASVGAFASKKQKKALDMLGMSPQDFKDARGNMIPVMDMVRKVELASRAMDNISRKEVLSALFNVRGQRGLVNLFGDFDPTKTMESLRAQIRKGVTDDVAINQARRMTDDLASDFIRLGVSTQQLKEEFSRAAEPVLRFGLYVGAKIMKGLSWFTGTGLGKVVTSIALVVTPLIGVLFLFRAAALTATLALRAMAMTGGYGMIQRGLMGGGMGAPPVTRNAAGNWYVRGGSTYTYNGKLYKGGQMLPGAFGAGVSGAGMFAGSMLGGFFGMGGANAFAGMTGTLGKILAPVGAFLPYLLPISLGITALSALISAWNAPREELSEENKRYLNFLEREVYAKRSSDPMANERMNQQFNQKIQLNIDGKAAYEKELNDILNKPVQDIGLNLSH